MVLDANRSVWVSFGSYEPTRSVWLVAGGAADGRGRSDERYGGRPILQTGEDEPASTAPRGLRQLTNPPGVLPTFDDRSGPLCGGGPVLSCLAAVASVLE